MSQTTVQGKQQALIRVAESRVAALDAVASTQKQLSRCIGVLPVSPSFLLKMGAAAGMAASVMGAVSVLKRKKKTAEKLAAKSGGSPAGLVPVVVQLLAPVLLPMAQRLMQKWAVRSTSSVNGRPVDF